MGNDTSNYVGYFTGTNPSGIGYGTVKYPGSNMEIGFILIGRFLSLFSHNGTFFLLAHAMFVWMAIVMFYKDRKNALWSLLLMIVISSSSSIIVMNVAIRQSFSIGFVLWGFYLLKDVDYSMRRKLLRNVRFILSVLCIVFAIIVHRTSIMLIPLAILLYFVRTDKRWVYYTAIIASFIISQFLLRDVGEFFDTVLENIAGVREENVALLGNRYEGSFGERHFGIFGNLTRVLLGLLVIYLSNKHERSSYAFKCLIFWICFFLLFNSSYMVNRLTALFYVVGMTAFIPEKVNKHRGYLALYLLITAYFLARAYLGFESWGNADSCLPYYFFWE